MALQIPTPCPLQYSSAVNLLNVGLCLEVLSRDEFWDVVLIVIILVVLAFRALTLLLLHALVALGQLAQGGQGVGTELVEDARDELGQFLVFTVSVDGEGVGRY